MRDRRGIILLEVVVVIGLALFCFSQVFSLYTDFVRIKRTAIDEYQNIYLSKRLLLSSLEDNVHDPKLKYVYIEDNLLKIVDPITGMWVYKYEK